MEILLLLSEGDLDVVLVLYGPHVVIVGIGSRLEMEACSHKILRDRNTQQ
jgi:hypothetical protein